MQSNRFKLAMEVSTKCQLDTGDVLAAWGVACLKYGDFQAARSKFRSCFQVSHNGCNHESICIDTSGLTLLILHTYCIVMVTRV